MNKTLVLRIILVIISITLFIPVYYVIKSATDVVVSNILTNDSTIKDVLQEYIQFTGLESSFEHDINKTKYNIYLTSETTDSLITMHRYNKKLFLETTQINNVYGTVQNQTTLDVFRFQSKFLTILNNGTAAKMHDDFSISIKSNKVQDVVNMYGNNLLINLTTGQVSSTKPIMMFSTQNILFGGNFILNQDSIVFNGGVILDSASTVISAKTLSISMENNNTSIHNDIFVQTLTFTGNVEIVKKDIIGRVFADMAIYNPTEKTITLIGNVIVKNKDVVITSNKMIYNIEQQMADIVNAGKTRPKITIQY